MMRLHLQDVDATEMLARALAQSQPQHAIVYLQGDLGAGKSTLARAWLRALGVSGSIRSPTYTLVEHYRLAGGANALHLDLYRIADAAELEFLALDDAAAALWLVEWADRGHGALPVADLGVELALDGEGRSALLREASPAGAAWLKRLAETAGCEALLNPGERKSRQTSDN